jgi:hypothetical protein
MATTTARLHDLNRWIRLPRMRKAYRCLLPLLLAPAVVASACGGDDTTDGGTDAAADNTLHDASSVDGSDASQDTGATDAGTDSATDASTDSSTDAGTDAADGSINVSCLHPADCFDGGADAADPPDSGEVCCGTLVTTGMLPSCTFVSLTTQCTAPSSCTSNVPLSCTTDTIRGCQHASECIETGYDQCCTFNGGDAGNVQFCAGSIVAEFSLGCLDAGQ